jgi:hypothetical protein
MQRPSQALMVRCAAAFAPLFSLAQSPDSVCKIEGQVLSAATGSPLKNATLKLTMRGLVQPPSHSVNDGTFETTSGSEGRFLFDAIPPAKYRLSAERTGYVVGGYNGILDCAATTAEGNSPNRKDIVVKLTPQAIISGHVVDDDGEPVPDASVEILRRTWVDGSRRLNKIALEETHADGSFAIGALTAGRYYLRASHRKEEDEAPEPGRKGSIKEAFVPTDFPAALDIASATPLDVAAGAQIPIDIRLKKSRAFRVSGKVVTSASKSLLDGIELDLFQQDGPPATPSAEIEDGRFEFRDVLPGSYILRPDSGSHSLTLVGSIAITVRDEDVRDAMLMLAPPLEIKVNVNVELGDFEYTSPPFLYFLPGDGRSPTPSWTPGKAGKLTVELAPGSYRLLVVHSRYLKSVRLNAQDATADKLDLTAPGTLDLVFSMNGGQINPVVRDADGNPALHPQIQVCDSGGSCTTRFTQQLAPGDYRVCAWADDGDGIITVPGFRAALESQCAKVTLAEKSHENVELKLITKEMMEVEAAKMP